MGKYAKILKNLDPLPVDKPKFQEKVDKEKENIPVGTTPVELAKMYRQRRKAKDELDAKLSIAEVELTAVVQRIAVVFEAQDVTSIKLDDGSSVSLQPEPYAQIEDREAFRAWCQTNGFERAMILPWQTMNALTKERLLSGEAEPDGVKAFSRTKIVLRGAK